MKKFTLTQNHQSNQPTNLRPGFTIVEILIVIVIIGILATITIVAYNGIQQNARVVSLQSDLSNADASLALAYTQTGTYPANLAGAGLSASPGTTFLYAYRAADNSYCLTATNGGTSYVISTSNPTPLPGVCPVAAAPAAPINLAATGGPAQISLTWTAPVDDGGSAISNYKLYRGTTANPTTLVQTLGNVTSYADTGLAGGTTYYFRIIATNSIGDSPYSVQVSATATAVNGGVVTTLAGSGVAGFTNSTGTSAQFNNPYGVAVDSAGNVYVGDALSHRIRKITPAGVVTTLAGSGVAGFADGTGTSAQFNVPIGVAVDSVGNVYVGDQSNHRIRKITPAGVVTTLAGSGVGGFADGAGASAQFYNPQNVAVDSVSNVYVADYNNHRIRKITPAGVVTTLAGSGVGGFADGAGASAQFNYPKGVAADSAGNVYVGDYFNNRIRKITPAGVVTTLAGSGVGGFADGAGASAQFFNPAGVAVDSAGTVYVGDISTWRIRKITPAGVVSTLAGSVAGFANGTGASAQFRNPFGVAVDSVGTVYVGDYGDHRIRKIQ